MKKKILFLAMSGVRVQNPELLALGLTLPGFVERSKVIASLPSLGLLTLAAHTPSDWELDYVEWDKLPPHPVSWIVQQGHTVVAISCLTARILECYQLCRELKPTGLVTIVGGLHVSAMPAEAGEFADIVVQGEGEFVWSRLLKDLEQGRALPSYSSFIDGARNPGPLPHLTPRYDLLDIERYNRITLQTTRGCPLDCSFCGASRTISRYRKMNLLHVRDDLEAILARWNRPFLELADDNTFFDKVWSRDLCSLFKDYDIRWFTETDITVADDPSLLEILAESGCRQLLIGLESARPANLMGMDKAGIKHRYHQRARKAIQRIQSHGISVNACFILGQDQDDALIFPQTLELIDTLDSCEVQITMQTPFPGTGLYQQLNEQGRLDPHPIWNRCTLFDSTHEPRNMSRDELEQGFHWLMGQVYSTERIAKRRRMLRKSLSEALSNPQPPIRPHA